MILRRIGLYLDPLSCRRAHVAASDVTLQNKNIPVKKKSILHHVKWLAVLKRSIETSVKLSISCFFSSEMAKQQLKSCYPSTHPIIHLLMTPRVTGSSPSLTLMLVLPATPFFSSPGCILWGIKSLLIPSSPFSGGTDGSSKTSKEISLREVLDFMSRTPTDPGSCSESVFVCSNPIQCPVLHSKAHHTARTTCSNPEDPWCPCRYTVYFIIFLSYLFECLILSSSEPAAEACLSSVFQGFPSVCT